MGARVEQVARNTQVPKIPGIVIHDDSADYLGGGARTTAAERIDWASVHMPVVAAMSRMLADRHDLAAQRIGMCLVLEPKTAVLALALHAAGAHVSAYAPPHETDPEIAAELTTRGVTVFADPTATPAQAEKAMDAFLSGGLHLLIDDGGRAIRRAHHVPGALENLLGGAEETTSGLRNLAQEPGGLRIPVIAVNDARSKTWFDNAIGTGQSCVSTILDLIDPSEDQWTVVGKRAVVAGYGPVGRGVARHLTALGGDVTVIDTDPPSALRAATDGYRVAANLVDAAAHADLVISATGYPATITPEVLHAAENGTYFAVAGGVDDEIQWAEAIAESHAEWVPLSPNVEELRYPNGHRVTILDRGRCINCSAGEGNPIEIMDLSFGIQLSALDLILSRGTELRPGVHPIPRDADQRVSAIGLATLTGNSKEERP